jgi:hypothetical protein
MGVGNLMTDKQPEALRLADALDLYSTGDEHQRDVEQAAAELRRLHEVNAELVYACTTIVKAFDALEPDSPARYVPLYINTARNAIAKATGEQQ